MDFCQIAYHSTSTVGGEPRVVLNALRDILDVATRMNAQFGITGYLLFDRTHFAQILEGRRDPVMRLVDNLRRDPRHRNVTIMGTRTTFTRAFPDWSMAGGLRRVDQEEIFLRHGFSQTMDVDLLTFPRFLALAIDLQDQEDQRRREVDLPLPSP